MATSKTETDKARKEFLQYINENVRFFEVSQRKVWKRMRNLANTEAFMKDVRKAIVDFLRVEEMIKDKNIKNVDLYRKDSADYKHYLRCRSQLQKAWKSAKIVKKEKNATGTSNINKNKKNVGAKRVASNTNRSE